MDIKETDVLGDDIVNHWYYRSKAMAMTRLLARTRIRSILDVGAGSGFFSRHLLLQSEAAEAWCVDINYDHDSDAMAAGKPVHFRRSIDSADVDLVLLMDVLEHVDDDIGLLMEYAGKVPPGSLFLISVPAFQFLWSHHDIFLEHRRRYTLRQIEGVARRAGLDVEQGMYYFGAVFPIAAAIRITGKLFRGIRKPHTDLKPHHPIVNEALAALSRAELRLSRHNRLAGLTAFCLARNGKHGIE
ncbi:MAG: class I SAM-dependent methyltransferase [Zoogloeaceae bacterium]|jgi:SAM-dependent methyltransferase|nr:class I SAM-dependent methyltransferase [Zoogloeaceae bacterium]